MGSKNRIAKDIISIIEPYLSKDKMYYEPFVGGANMIDKIPKDKVKGLVGNDMNQYLIALLNKMKSDDEIPYQFIEKEDWYKNYLYPFRKGQLYMDDWEIGYLGFTKTFSGQFMGSYSGQDIHRKQNYQQTKYNNIINQRPNLKGINFISGSYLDLEIQPNSIIYIDGPYKDTFKYKDDIDHEKLYKWIKYQTYNNGCICFISEYEMPLPFIPIWEKELKKGLGNKKQKEKLFILNS
jgi:DNA adenine methylase